MKIYFHLNLEGFSNCYVIVNELTSEAIIVDPGIITPQIIENIENGDYKLTGVLVTHNHGSHVHGLQTLRKIYSPKIFAADWEVAGNETSVLKDEGIIQIAGLTVGYTSVPGHTPDSMVYKIGSVLFTGDVISAGKIGSSNNKFSEKALIKNINEICRHSFLGYNDFLTSSNNKITTLIKFTFFYIYSFRVISIF